ncbi:AraC family transcriptional regulator [Kribbia dieselivorans]|uniref:AraC family transcriptional regulator n=1 Tax=Kribbia dieselivorans TaxID=331526 RepID=UPI000838FDEE|nr:AraC family transcriptional regulator [Kribbia dieselivorans]
MRHLLESRPTFEDWEGVHGVLSDAYFPHALKPRSAAAGAALSGIEAIDLGSCRLAHIRFGATVSIASDHPGAMAVNIPLAGRLASSVGGHDSDAGPGLATAFPADTPARMPAWGPEVDLLGLRIDSHLLQRESERTFARRGVTVPLEIDLRTPAGEAWFRLARTTFDNAREGGGVLYEDPKMAESVASMLVTGLLLAAVPEEAGPSGPTRPRTVHRVIAAMEADPARAWSPADLAEIAGVSVRRLQQSFREHVGLPPLAYLQDLRLERVHDDLVHGRGSSVTEISMAWGFSHLGRFAGAYRQRYGCTPSQTWARRG